MAWSQMCAWVRVFPAASDGLGLHAPSVERHGQCDRVWRQAEGSEGGLTVGAVEERIAVP